MINQFIDNVNLIDVVSISVSILALLLVIFFQYLRQKPILSFRIARRRHFYVEAYKQLGIDIEIAVDNVGERGTTIHDVELLDAFPREIYKLFKTSYAPPYEIDVPPHSTKRFHYQPSSKKELQFKPVAQEILFELQISWTHGKKIMRIRTQCDS